MAKNGPVRWGVISTANIGVAKVLPGMMKSKEIEIRAIASRTLPTARRWAKKLGIPVAYGSYEDMLNDPEIEAVYNPLPNHLHVPLTLEAAAARASTCSARSRSRMSADEAKLLSAAGRKVHIAEAFMVRNHPQWLKARELAQSGKLGTLRAIQSLFSYYNVDPKNVRNMADIGGGAIYDIGCYPVVVSRFIFGAEPVRCMALIDRDPKFRTDRLASAADRFRQGPPPHLHRLDPGDALSARPHPRRQGRGSRSRFRSMRRRAARMKIYLDNGKQLGDASAKAIKLPKADQYQLQGEYFSRVVRGTEKLAFGVDDAIKQARVLDAIFRSAKSGHWEKP